MRGLNAAALAARVQSVRGRGSSLRPAPQPWAAASRVGTDERVERGCSGSEGAVSAWEGVQSESSTTSMSGRPAGCAQMSSMRVGAFVVEGLI